MCRMIAVRADRLVSMQCPAVTSATSLRHQSACDYRGDCHPDGWGVGWYDGALPHVVRGLGNAAVDDAYAAAVGRVVAATVLVHVRKASVGTVNLENAHPFVFGHWLFAHNGTIYEYDRLAAALAAETAPALQASRHGSTDSEQVFFWLLSRVAKAGLPLDRPVNDHLHLGRLLADALAELLARCRAIDPASATALNLILTDGESLVASRWQRTLWISASSLDDVCPECGRRHTDGAPGGRAVIIASQPTAAGNWSELADGDVLVVSPRLEITRLRTG